MSKYKDLIEFLFIQKESEGLFELKNDEMKNLEKKMDITDSNITKFIDERIHPRSRKQLKKLIMDYTLTLGEYFRCENEILYRSGFSDGAKIILTVLSSKWFMLYIIYRAFLLNIYF